MTKFRKKWSIIKSKITKDIDLKIKNLINEDDLLDWEDTKQY